MKSSNTLFAIIVLGLILVQALLIFCAWIFCALYPTVYIRSLLSEDGIRWLFSTCVENLLSPLLIWIIMFGVSIGVFMKSGFRNVCRNKHDKQIEYRKNFSFYLSVVVALILLLGYLFLSFAPHAILVGVTGSLYPSAFSFSIVPFCAFILFIVSTVYGFSSGIISDLGSWMDSMRYGIQIISPLLLIYLIGMELYKTVIYIFYL